jgi:acyl carrier protein
MNASEELVRTVMGKVFGIDGGSIPETASRENVPQWDSLAHMNFLLALEDELGFEFSDEEIAGLDSLAAVVASIEEKQA